MTLFRALGCLTNHTDRGAFAISAAARMCELAVRFAATVVANVEMTVLVRLPRARKIVTRCRAVLFAALGTNCPKLTGWYTTRVRVLRWGVWGVIIACSTPQKKGQKSKGD